jgi:site-specific recombinase XerD
MAVAREGRRVGLAKGALHPHGLRHFHAVELMRAGVHAGKIQRLLGHANLAVTTVYLSRFGDGEALDEQAAVFENPIDA